MIRFLTHVEHISSQENYGIFFVNNGTYCSDIDTILGKQTFM